jgi:mono/diheme cytochrome c family protein
MPITPTFLRARLVRVGLVLLSASSCPNTLTAADQTGEQIYREMCIRCHGPAGEGTKKAPKPLLGDKSLAQLTKVIDETMPEDDPDKLDAAGSAKVAAYIHDAFYSPTAQARTKPARVELARLTNGQYRNAVADVIGGFRSAPKVDERRGLRGEYFNARGFQTNRRLIDRIDPEVQFDFGIAAPGEKFDTPHQYAIRWEGSVLAPETGSYEFVVRTEHATRLWVNDLRTPLIDAWVKSGNDTEYRGSIPLLAGRAYSVKLEFSKAKQGVDDSKKNPNPPLLKASVTLLWKPPFGTTEVIPARHLMPARSPEGYVIATPFPPDDRSLGWERGTTISKEWDAATTEAAIEAASYVAARLPELAGVSDNAKSRTVSLKEFCKKFAERAFRRPLTADQKRTFVDRPFETSDPDTAVKRVILFVLKSPRFLYREVGGGPDGYDVASRLSFALWDSIPDDELLKAAAAGKLATPEQVAIQAERMVADPRTRAKVRSFLLTWLKVEQPPDVSKDPRRFPGFDAAVASDLRASLELFLDDVVWSGSGDFRKLLLADELFLNGPLAKLYGADLPPTAPFRKVKPDAGKRAGVLTHPYLLAAFAYTTESSPIHRGVFVARGILGLSLRPPPEAVAPLSANLHPKLSTRDRVTLQTKPQACITCHGVVNPLGFTLEHFDAIGRYREQDNGKPVDSSGSYLTRAGTVATFAGPQELAHFLADNAEVHAAFAEQLFHHLIRQPVRAYGPATLEELRKGFAANDFAIRKLIVAIAVAGALPVEAKRNPSEGDQK